MRRALTVSSISALLLTSAASGCSSDTNDRSDGGGGGGSISTGGTGGSGGGGTGDAGTINCGDPYAPIDPTAVIDDMETPNGILISADNRTLYVVDHNPDPGGARTLLAYGIDEAGRCARRALLHDYGAGDGGDGMVLDVEGNIYLTAGDGEAAGVYIFAPDGEQLGLIAVPETAGNCTFGGPDLRTLYIAASSSLYRIRLGIPGLLAYPPPA